MKVPDAWRVPSDEPPPLRYWDGEYAVYNPLTGDTHVLDIATGEILRLIMEGSSTPRELCGHIARFLDVPDDETTAEHVARILLTLDELGLIEPASGC